MEELEFYVNAPISFPISFTDENGNSLDISGNEISLMVKKNIYDNDTEAKLDLTFTCPSNQDSINGIYNILVLNHNLSVGSYVFEIDYIVNNIVNVIVGAGKLIINDKVRKQ